MKRTFAIGDLHGCAATFKYMLFEQLKIQKEDVIYCLGDYIDRGPESKGVIDLIFSLQGEDFNIKTLRGNHEEMMMQSVNGLDNFSLWFQNGGNSTLHSFGVESYSEMHEKYKMFFEQTKFCFETDEFILAHAGLNFNSENMLQDTYAMLWARDFKCPKVLPGNKFLVHGHTPKSLSFILNQTSSCINIDGGCVYKQHKKYGNLVALHLEEKKYHVVKCLD